MPLRTLFLLFISCMLFSPLFAEEVRDTIRTSQRKSSSVVGGTLQKIFDSKGPERKRESGRFKRNTLGTKESTFSVGMEVEPSLIGRYNFHHSIGINLFVGGSLDHYNKWLFFKMGSHQYDLSKGDLLYGHVVDSSLYGFTLGLRYKNYTPRTVNQLIASYIMLEMETEAIIWEYTDPKKAESGGTVKNDIVSNYSLGSGGGFTFLNRSHVRIDLSFCAGVRFYQEQTMMLEDGSFEKYDNTPFDTDFYLRSSFAVWITREN